MSTNIINTFKTIKEVEAYRQEVNEMCDKRTAFITLCEEANNLSEKKFGYIKESFESISPMLFKTNEGKKILNKYTKIIKENKNLSLLHTIYENIRKAGKNIDVDFFVNNMAETKWGINTNTLSEDTKKLGRVLAEGYLCVGESTKNILPKENSSLDKAVEYIAENTKTNKNIAEYSNAVKIIKENVLLNNNATDIFESSNNVELSDELIKEFNIKYTDKLTEEEVRTLKEISCSTDRESVFNKYKEVCTNKITEAKSKFEKDGDKASSDRLQVVLEQIISKSYSKETVGNDICNLIELSNIF
jgi:hypothetical protein